MKLPRLEGDMTLVKWMLSILLAGVASLVLKAFVTAQVGAGKKELDTGSAA